MRKLAAAPAALIGAAALAAQILLAGRAEAPRGVSAATENAGRRPGPSVEVLAVGDIMPARWVERRLRANGYGYPFAETAEILRGGQITFGNLESPLADGEPVEAFQMVFRGDPEFAPALRDAGFDIVSTANNHAGDQGEAGIASTLEALEGAGISVAGSGDGPRAAAPAVIETPTGSVAFLAYADGRWFPDSYVAGENRQGINLLESKKISADVKDALAQADFVIVSVHAGTEYEPLPDSVQRDAAEAAAEAGASLVIGHHPHVLQPIEKIGTTTVAWSLGNFVFDQDFSPETQESAIARFRISENGVEASAFPARIHDYAQPRPTKDAAARATAEKLFGGAEPCPGETGWWCPQKENAD